MFADNTAFISYVDNFTELYTTQAVHLQQVFDWYSNYKFTVNLDKTEFILIKPTDETFNHEIKVNNLSLKRTKSKIYLGIQIDNMLT